MESHTRNLWIFVVVVGLGMCLCAAVVTAVGLGAIALPRLNLDLGVAEADRIEQSFTVGTAPALQVDNFAGGVTVRPGPAGTIQVIAVKKGFSQSTRDRIQVQMTEQADGVLIKTERPSGLSSGSVDLEIVAPADTRLQLHTGSGGVVAEDMAGPATVDTGSGGIDLLDVKAVERAETGSGGITVRGASGPIRLQTGSGGIEYEGAPQGECRFHTGSGGIDLALPADLNARVDLSTGSGSIRVGFPVSGQVNPKDVQGTIGDGSEATIYAETGSGSIELTKQ